MSVTLVNSAGTEINYRAGSLSFDDTVNKRGTMSFAAVVNRYIELVGGGYLELITGEIVEAVGHTVPIEVGADIFVKLDGTTIWGGTVEEYTETDLTEGAVTHNVFQYRCIDFDEIAGRRLVAEAYTAQTAGAIVEDIRATYLDGYGVTAGDIADGPTIQAISFNYVTAESALNELATITGYAWCIDENKALCFEARDTAFAAWDITANNKPYRNLRITKNRSKYRNTQFMRAGYDVTGALTETQNGDGTRRTFVLEYEVGADDLAVRTDTGAGLTARTVGILGVDTGKDWYYSIGSNVVSQDSGGTLLTSAHTLEVSYKGRFPIIVKAEDQAAIAERVAAEVGPGIYESVLDDTTINDDDAALDKALGLLARHSMIPVTVTYETDAAGLRGGTLQTITLSDHGLSGQYLIESVNGRVRENGDLVYSVKALSGQAVGGWAAFFRSLVEQGRDFVIRDNEVLIILRAIADSVEVVDSAVATTSTAFAIVGDATAIVGLIDVG